MEGEEKMENAILTKSENQNMNNLISYKESKETAVSWLQATGKVKKLTNGEIDQFVDICVAFALNPFKREIYCVKYGDNFNIIVGYEVYLKRAERTGLLTGWRCWIDYRSDKSMVAKIEINRLGWQHPFYHEVSLAEYDQHNSMWKNKPETMLKKVAMSQGFRLCFPDELGGMPYTADELPDSMTTDAPLPQKEAKAEPSKADVVAKVMGGKPEVDVKAIGEKIKALSTEYPEIITDSVLAEARKNFTKDNCANVLKDLERLVNDRLNIDEGASKAFDKN